MKDSDRLWPALQVKRRPLSSLLPYANNARTHSQEQVSQIAASIREWGWTMPVLVDEHGGIIAGHGRVLAAQGLGITHVPTMVASGWTAEQVRAYRLADNKLALNADWNGELLKLELGDLQSLGFDLGLIGFGLDELAGLLDSTKGLTDPDDAPPVPDEPVSREGDVWRLGRHRLVCGDSTRAAVVDAALAGVRPHLMVTDPPYGVEYDASWRQRAGVGSAGAATGAVMNDDRADWRTAWALFPGEVAYVWHGSVHCAAVADSLASCRFVVRSQIVWVKTRHVLSRGHYHQQHEPLFYAEREAPDAPEGAGYEAEHDLAAYAVRRGATGHWAGGRKQSTVWFIEHLRSETGHSTQKPVECMRRPIENNSVPGQAIYEPFSGSGTTLIAAEMTGRSCHAIELDPGYCDVAVLRWQAFTGQAAVLEGSGGLFAEVAAVRARVAA